MNRSIVIRYNWDERDESKWLFWLEKKLRALGFTVSVEPLPEFRRDETPAIVSDIRRTHGVLGKDTFIVPHDPGCLTLMKYCERLIRSGKDDPTLLIAAVPAAGTAASSAPLRALEAGKTVAQTDSDADTFDAHSLDDTLRGMNVKLMVVYGGVLPEAHHDIELLSAPRARALAGRRGESFALRVARWFGW